MRDYAGCAARGLTMPETARELGVTLGAVWSAAKVRNLTFRDARKHSRERYERCAADGMTQTEAARFLGVSRQSVCMAAQRHGISFRVKQRKPKGFFALLTQSQREDYRTLRLHGYSRAYTLRAIGREDLVE